MKQNNTKKQEITGNVKLPTKFAKPIIPSRFEYDK